MCIEGEPVPVVTPYDGKTDDDDGRPVIATARSRPDRIGEWGPGKRISRRNGHDLHRRADFNNLPRGALQVPHHSFIPHSWPRWTLIVGKGVRV